jgi:Domain of unknown function (DUF4126)
MTELPLIFTSGWASGINSYAVVLVLGLLGRYGHQAGVPPALERTDVLAVMALLFCGQFVVGKIPYLDSAWDLVHTAIRPVIGGAIGLLMAHHAHGTLAQAVAATVVGGGTALVTHLAKTGVRMGINVSPEPVSNIVASLLEDVTVGALVSFALLHPVPAAIIAAVLLVLGLVLAVMLAARIRAGWRRRRERRLQRHAARAAAGPAG